MRKSAFYVAAVCFFCASNCLGQSFLKGAYNLMGPILSQTAKGLRNLPKVTPLRVSTNIPVVRVEGLPVVKQPDWKSSATLSAAPGKALVGSSIPEKSLGYLYDHPDDYELMCSILESSDNPHMLGTEIALEFLERCRARDVIVDEAAYTWAWNDIHDVDSVQASYIRGAFKVCEKALPLDTENTSIYFILLNYISSGTLTFIHPKTSTALIILDFSRTTLQENYPEGFEDLLASMDLIEVYMACHGLDHPTEALHRLEALEEIMSAEGVSEETRADYHMYIHQCKKLM